MNKHSLFNSLFYRLDKLFYRLDNKRRIEHANNRVVKLPRIKLSSSEEVSFHNNWRGYQSISYEFYKAFGMEFNSHIVPNDYYDFAEHVLNLRWASFFLQHKCNLKYIIPEINRPKTILQKIDGHYVFEDNTEISKEEAIHLLRSHEKFVCKVALGSGGGRGVQKVCWNQIMDPELFLEKLLKPVDLIFQDVILQSDFMSSLNPDSVNTIRLLTLNINGKCTLLSSFIRMGSKGSFIDNFSSGGGAVGLSHDGFFSKFGVRKDFSNFYETPSGLLFKGLQVPDWNKVKEKILCFHQHIPYANLIGWDIAIDKENKPVVIEINLDSAEIELHQLFNGPVFGDRFNEVREYIEQKKPLLRHAMITY